MFNSDFNNQSVFVTGHTGFKGSWLSIWLKMLGTRIHGFALDPPTDPSLFEQARISEVLATDTRADLADFGKLQEALNAAQPEVLYHLAAQPFVRESYHDPLGTFQTNVMGTANLLQAIRGIPSVKAVVVITTDKVYENREWVYPYREIDPLGGYDPYSASKAAAELVTASLRASFFDARSNCEAAIATARAGNVFGGGDWAPGRLIPDCLRAFASGEAVRLRYPDAVRPWQHVLDSLSGYLKLAMALLGENGREYAAHWNFGPETNKDCTVRQLAETLASLWGEGAAVGFVNEKDALHEAGLLRMDSSKARKQLKWQPCWTLEKSLGATVSWFRAWLANADMQSVCRAQIREYSAGNKL